MKNRLRNKKLRSLASRCLTSDDTLSDARDLLAFYKVDFEGFFHRFSIDYLGFSEEVPSASRKPPQRKSGERPEKKSRNKKQELQKSGHEEDQDIPMEPPPEKLSWEKKLYRQIMMQVHPDRLDAISKNSKDRLLRMGFAEKMIHAPGPEIILSIGIQLGLEVELEIFAQRKLLFGYLKTAENELNSIKSMAGWVWGESIDNIEIRLDVIKQICKANGFPVPEDTEILGAIKDYI